MILSDSLGGTSAGICGSLPPPRPVSAPPSLTSDPPSSPVCHSLALLLPLPLNTVSASSLLIILSRFSVSSYLSFFYQFVFLLFMFCLALHSLFHPCSSPKLLLLYCFSSVPLIPVPLLILKVSPLLPFVSSVSPFIRVAPPRT